MAADATYDRAQARVDACYKQMYAPDGYFRDPYNCWDVLWQLGLSWWEDVLPYVGSDCYLSAESVQELLDLVNERIDHFEAAISELPREDRNYLRERLDALQGFLLSREDLDPHERGVLAEHVVELTDGQFKEKNLLKFQRLEDRVLFLCRRFSKTPIDRSAAYWSEFVEAARLRNNLTHPM